MVPEVLAWVAPEVCPLYRRLRVHAPPELAQPDELWVITTDGAAAAQGCEALLAWWQALGAPIPLRIWVGQGTGDLADGGQCREFRELVFRVAFTAREAVGRQGKLLLSLAGGRKTMSADLQAAAEWFGAEALIHIVGREPLPDLLRHPTPASFTRPLPEDLAAAIHPVHLGGVTAAELVSVPVEGEPLAARHYPVGLPAPGCSRVWRRCDGAYLIDALERRRQEAGTLFGNFIAELTAQTPYDPWPSLARLPAASLAWLRTELSEAHRDWLTALPKADLHSHLGGQLALPAQRAVARAVLGDARPEQREAARRAVDSLLRCPVEAWDWNWPIRLADGASAQQRALRAACLLEGLSDPAAQAVLYDATAPRVALKSRHPYGFSAYERPGELTGSAQLGHPAALAPYAAAVVARARAEGLRYLELRGSPQKYRAEDPIGFLVDLKRALREAGAATTDQGAGAGQGAAPMAAPMVGFIWILDRRRRQDIGATVRSAVAARERLGDFLLGLDLAGDEGTQRPEALAPDFLPAFEACLPITIHAGEGESADSIWQAAYHLHADRIGHGLSLAEHPSLARRFRDRGIVLELCPTSNREVVGYCDPELVESHGLPAYPLRSLIDLGVPLTLATDNPAINRSTLADEYLAAARMSGGLKLIEVLSLVQQAFHKAFAPAHLRTMMQREADRSIYRILSRNLPAP